MKDLLRTEHLSREDVELILDTAAQFASKPMRSKDALANQTVAIYMTKSSTRTRLASETAVATLVALQFSYAEKTYKLVEAKLFLIPQKS